MFEFDIHEKIPTILKDIYEFKVLDEVESQMFDIAKNEGNNFILNNYNNTILEEGLSRYEKFLNLIVSPDMTIQDRRNQLQAVWNSYLPYTHQYLISILNTMVGEDNYILEEDYTNYEFSITIMRDFVDSIVQILRNIMPLNIKWTVYVVTPRSFEGSQIYGGVYIKTIARSFQML